MKHLKHKFENLFNAHGGGILKWREASTIMAIEHQPYYCWASIPLLVFRMGHPLKSPHTRSAIVESGYC